MHKMDHRMAQEGLGRKFKFAGSLAMLAVGLAFYWGYGFAYGEWNLFSPGNDGVYSVVVFFVGIGIVGSLLFRKKPARQ